MDSIVSNLEHRPTKRRKFDFRRRWRTDSDHQIYSSKLLHALHRVTHKSASPPARSSIRETADRVLAVAAKGKTRWSRAILTNRLHLKLKKLPRNCSRPKKFKIRYETTKLPPLQNKVRTLARLVPGCRKISFPNLLEEATDYIAALQMQVRAMAALADLLAAAPPDPQTFRTNS